MADVQIRGVNELRARLTAIKPNPNLMRNFALAAIAEQKRLVPRRTGNLGRSIRLGAVTPTVAETIATADYAAFVELGTRPHTIVPRNAKALSWKGGSNKISVGGYRFSSKIGSGLAPGSIVGVETGDARPKAGRRFAKRVRHPGTRAQPYMVPGAKRALDDLGVDAIVQAWDGAA